MPKAKYVMCSIEARAKILQFLRNPDVLRVADGFAEYKHPWTDKLVAEHLTREDTDKVLGAIHTKHVGNIRATRFGKTPPKPKVEPKQRELDFIGELEDLSDREREMIFRRIEELEGQVEFLLRQWAKVIARMDEERPVPNGTYHHTTTPSQ
jgi:hypothetical protein